MRVPTSVRGELDRLVARNAPGAAAARALAQRFPALPAVGRGDAAVLRAAVQQKASVVTADRALRERLRQQGVPVLYPRDRHRLELFDPASAPRGPPAARRPRHG